jgi:hypothetical protein
MAEVIVKGDEVNAICSTYEGERERPNMHTALWLEVIKGRGQREIAKNTERNIRIVLINVCV